MEILIKAIPVEYAIGFENIIMMVDTFNAQPERQWLRWRHWQLVPHCHAVELVPCAYVTVTPRQADWQLLPPLQVEFKLGPCINLRRMSLM